MHQLPETAGELERCVHYMMLIANFCPKREANTEIAHVHNQSRELPTDTSAAERFMN